MNLTKAIAKAFGDLSREGHFNGLEVVGVRFESEEQKRKDAADDGLDAEQTERWVNDYTCCGIHLDAHIDAEECPYFTHDFLVGSLERDFKAWLLPYLDGDETVFPEGLDFSGGDMEFMKPGYGENKGSRI